MPNLCILTAADCPNLTRDDQFLLQELKRQNIAYDIKIWGQEAANWDDYDAILARSVNGYYKDMDAFAKFLKSLPAAKLYNPAKDIIWNADKHYLQDLERAGVTIPATQIVTNPAELTINSFPTRATKLVIKPTISAAAFMTYCCNRDDDVAIKAHITEITAQTGGAAIVQEFLPDLVENGEISFITFGGNFSHAVLKTPAQNDFRCQDQHGGSLKPFEPKLIQLRKALAVLSKAPITKPPLYARIDGIFNGDEFIVMELELIEPTLFFEAKAGAAKAYMDAMLTLIS